MNDQDLLPPGTGYRELDARLRPLEIQVNRMDAALSDIPRRQSHLETEMSGMRAQQGEILALLREVKSRLDAGEARDDSPLTALAEAIHRQLDEKTPEPPAAASVSLAEIAQRGWQIAQLLALVLVVVLGGKQALGALG